MISAALEYRMELCRPISSVVGRLITRPGYLKVFTFRDFDSQHSAAGPSLLPGPHLLNTPLCDIRQSPDNLIYFSKIN